ncbi:MAG: hypothetical protein ACOY94_01890 [Bacillota bacterium]
MKVIAVTLTCTLAVTVADIWLRYPTIVALRPLVDIAITWAAAIAFSLYWYKRFGA